jgi:hypothetical protein
MVSKHAIRGTTKIPQAPVTWTAAPDPNWHPVAIRLYEGMIGSAQAQLYQDSDWATLWMYCTELSSLLFDPRPSAERWKALHSLGGDLLLTEGARRRSRIELGGPDGR